MPTHLDQGVEEVDTEARTTLKGKTEGCNSTMGIFMEGRDGNLQTGTRDKVQPATEVESAKNDSRREECLAISGSRSINKEC
jgi:hypothetical protein